MERASWSQLFWRTGPNDSGFPTFHERKRRLMKSYTIAKTFTIAAIAVLALGISPSAKADDKGCSVATLKGTFAHTASGFEIAPPAIAGPIAGVGMDTFDGKGGVTGTATISLNGTPVPVTYTGT